MTTEELSLGFMKIPDVMTNLNLSRQTIYNLMAAGELRSARFGTARRILRASMLNYIDRSTKQIPVGGYDDSPRFSTLQSRCRLVVADRQISEKSGSEQGAIVRESLASVSGSADIGSQSSGNNGVAGSWF